MPLKPKRPPWFDAERHALAVIDPVANFSVRVDSSEVQRASTWLREAGALAVSSMTDDPNPSPSQVYVPPEFRTESVEEVVQELRAGVLKEGIASTSMNIGGTSIPGSLILLAVPALAFVLNLYLIGHLSHLCQGGGEKQDAGGQNLPGDHLRQQVF